MACVPSFIESFSQHIRKGYQTCTKKKEDPFEVMLASIKNLEKKIDEKDAILVNSNQQIEALHRKLVEIELAQAELTTAPATKAAIPNVSSSPQHLSDAVQDISTVARGISDSAQVISNVARGISNATQGISNPTFSWTDETANNHQRKPHTTVSERPREQPRQQPLSSITTSQSITTESLNGMVQNTGLSNAGMLRNVENGNLNGLIQNSEDPHSVVKNGGIPNGIIQNEVKSNTMVQNGHMPSVVLQNGHMPNGMGKNGDNEHDIIENGIIETDLKTYEYSGSKVSFSSKSSQPVSEDAPNKPALNRRPSQIDAGLRRQFAVLDTDEDGGITPEQLTNVLRSIELNITDNEMESIIRRADVDGDGTITFNDFVAALERTKADDRDRTFDDRDATLRLTFQIFDKQNLGSIGPKEIWTVLKNLGKEFSLEEIEEMVEEVDDDGDSRITYAEFVQMVIGE